MMKNARLTACDKNINSTNNKSKARSKLWDHVCKRTKHKHYVNSICAEEVNNDFGNFA